MFWFTGAVVKEGEKPRDAGASTFYSAMSNINLRTEKNGNPHAVALRTHFAQHSFISYVAVYIGKGKAGLFDVGNELENVAFTGEIMAFIRQKLSRMAGNDGRLLF